MPTFPKTSFETLPDDILFSLLMDIPELRNVSKTLHRAAERLDNHLLLNYIRMGISSYDRHARHDVGRKTNHENDQKPSQFFTEFDEQILLDAVLNDSIISTFLAKRSYQVGMSQQYLNMLNHLITTGSKNERLQSNSKAIDKGKISHNEGIHKLIVSDRAVLLFLQRDICFFNKRHIITPSPETEIESVDGTKKAPYVSVQQMPDSAPKTESLSLNGGSDKHGFTPQNYTDLSLTHTPDSSDTDKSLSSPGQQLSQESPPAYDIDSNNVSSYHWQHITDPLLAPSSGTCVYAKNVHWLWLQYRTRLAPGCRYQVYLNIKTENAFSLAPIRFMFQENPYVKQTFQPFAPIDATAGQHNILGNDQTNGGSIYLGVIEVLVPPPAEIVELKRSDLGSVKHHHHRTHANGNNLLFHDNDSDSSDSSDENTEFVYYHDETSSYASTNAVPSGISSPNRDHPSHSASLFSSSTSQHTLPNVGTSYTSNSHLRAMSPPSTSHMNSESRTSSFSNLSNISFSTHTHLRSDQTNSHSHNEHSSISNNTQNTVVPHFQLHRQLQQIEREQSLEEQLEKLQDGTPEKVRAHRRLLRQKYGKGGSASGSSSVAALSAVVSAVESRNHSRAGSGASTPKHHTYNHSSPFNYNFMSRSGSDSNPHPHFHSESTHSHRSGFPKSELPNFAHDEQPSLQNIQAFQSSNLSTNDSQKPHRDHTYTHLNASLSQKSHFLKRKQKDALSRHPGLRKIRHEQRRAQRLEALSIKARPPSKWPTVVFEMEDTGVGINRGIQFNYLCFVQIEGSHEAHKQRHNYRNGTSHREFKQWLVIDDSKVPDFVQSRNVDKEMQQAFERLTELKNATAVLGPFMNQSVSEGYLAKPQTLNGSEVLDDGLLEQMVMGTGPGSASETSSGSGEDTMI